MTVDVEQVVNQGLIIFGELPITDIDDETVKAAQQAKKVYEPCRDECFDYKNIFWQFCSTRAALSKLYQLTLDSTPAPAAFAAGATLTGATSGVTCTVITKISSTVYLVTEPSGNFTDGEVISDGTNSRDCGAGYPVLAEITPAFGSYSYYYTVPNNVRKIKLCDADGDDVDYPLRREVYLSGSTVTPVILCNVDPAYAMYMVMLEDPQYWPSWFVHLVAVRIAMYLAEPLKQDTNIQTRIDYLWNKALDDAIAANAGWGMETDGNGRDLDRGNMDVLNAANPSDVRQPTLREIVS